MSRRRPKRSTPPPSPLVPAALALGIVGLAACGDQETGAFSPRGSAAAEISWLFWVMVGLGTAVFVAVMWLLVRAARTPGSDATGSRSPADEPPAPDRDEASATDDRDDGGDAETARRRRSGRLVIGGGVVLPVLILVPLTVAMLVVADRISPFTSDDDPVEIHVIGHQFWWEVRYPDTEAVTANEIRIPADTPVRLRLESADVIHSVWAPELAGKIDMIPGETTYLDIDATQPGEYLGQCAEFCGLQHARMRFLVIAMEPDEFDTWLAGEAEPAVPVTDGAEARGERVFSTAGCAACHTVRGTEATGDQGPDLTHVADRRTLAAATLPNDREHLADWIEDPQGAKPGNPMPPTTLSDADLSDLLAYLEALE